MRKVSNSPPGAAVVTPRRPKKKRAAKSAKAQAAAKPITKVKTSLVDPFKNGKADNFNFKDKGLEAQLSQLHGDAVTMQTRVPQQAEKALIVGTARSKPEPGGNGHADYVWTEGLGSD